MAKLNPEQLKQFKMMKRNGKCLHCGNCCHGPEADFLISTAKNEEANKQKESYIKYLDLHGVTYKVLPDRIRVYIGVGKCRNLVMDENGTSRCADYGNRPDVCNNFPARPNPMCKGFTFEEVPFDETKRPM